ncbi:MAG: DHH family phosphoesterase [Candidatus Helarchaeota archaeon]
MLELKNYFTKDNLKSILISTHLNSDPDGIFSSITFISFIKHFCKDCEVKIYSEDFTLITRKIIDELNYWNLITQDLDGVNPDVIVLIDVNNIEIIGKIKDLIINGTPFIVIDHHSDMKRRKYEPIFSIIMEDYSSAAEVIFELFEKNNIKLSQADAKNLLLGILYDTKHFTIATNRTFQIVNEILKKGVSYRDTIRMLRYPLERSEKIARLKAGNRAKIHTIGDWIIVSSEISSYEASACRGLLNLGADVAIVQSLRKNETRVSLRSTQEFYESTNISLSDLCIELIEIYKNSGNLELSAGGHTTAAGINTSMKNKSLIDTIIELIKKKLK